MGVEQAILKRLDGLYMPTPAEALRYRRQKPDSRTFDNHALYYDAGILAEIRGPEIWASRCLDTDYFTLHNGYVLIQVGRDTVADSLGDRLVWTVVMEGHHGSVFAELDIAQLNSTGRTGVFKVPLLVQEDLSLQTRIVLYAADNASYTEQHPWQQRFIDFTIETNLVAGLKF